MEDVEFTTRGTHLTKCCDCGSDVENHYQNCCVMCLSKRIDITEGIDKTAYLHFCRNCERYLQPPNHWVLAVPESRELLGLCLKKIKAIGNKEVNLVDASFMWTEPHSKRIRVKMTVEKLLAERMMLRQTFFTEFTVYNQMCDDCHRVEAKDFWRACVQVRQRIAHKKTLYYVEQQILKSKAHLQTTSIKQNHDGLDFFFAQKNEARRLVEFLQSCVPCRYTESQELISRDIKSNTANYKFSYCVEIVPIIKDGVVCLPPKLAQQLGNLNQLCIVSRVMNAVHLIDPNTAQVADINADMFWRKPFACVNHPKQLVEYIVMDIEIIMDKDKRHVKGGGRVSKKHAVADVWVTKASELGNDDAQKHCRTHLGHLLQPGDSVLGLDLENANVNDEYFSKMKPDRIPNVVLVKKMYSADSNKRQKKRKWKLERLHPELEEGKDYNDFQEDLEEDADFRATVNIYKDPSKMAAAATDGDTTDDDDAPQIGDNEMIDMMNDLDIGGDDATGEEGADMME